MSGPFVNQQGTKRKESCSTNTGASPNKRRSRKTKNALLTLGLCECRLSIWVIPAAWNYVKELEPTSTSVCIARWQTVIIEKKDFKMKKKVSQETKIPYRTANMRPHSNATQVHEPSITLPLISRWKLNKLSINKLLSCRKFTDPYTFEIKFQATNNPRSHQQSIC